MKVVGTGAIEPTAAGGGGGGCGRSKTSAEVIPDKKAFVPGGRRGSCVTAEYKHSSRCYLRFGICYGCCVLR
jgi:hypothetical protein